MSLIRRALGASTERRGASGKAEWGDSTPPTNGMLGGGVAGVNISEKTSLQVAAVYGSVSVLADAVSALPIHIVNNPESPTRKRLPPPTLITEPYSEISLTDWWVQYTVSMALRGNFFGHIIDRDSEFYPTQIKPVHPDRVGIRRMPDGTIEYRFNGRPVPTQDVFHVRYISVAEGLYGLNPVEYLRNSLGLARAQDLYGAAWFQNSATPSGLIQVPGDLDQDEIVRLAKQWMATHQGIGQSSLPAVLTGDAKWQTVSMNPEDSQFVESRGFSQGEISGMIFRVPPHMIGIVDRSTSWGRGIEQQETGFVRNTLASYIVRAERALTSLLRPNEYVEFDINQRMRGDTLERYQAYSLGILGGWLTADEIRAEESKPPLPNGMGEVTLAPINTEPLQAMLERVKREKDEAGKKEEPAKQPEQKREMRFNHHIEPHISVPVSVAAPRAPNVSVRTPPVNIEGSHVNIEPRIVVPEPTVTVAPPEVRVESPNVNVEAPNVNVEAPNVNVAPPEVRVDSPTVNVDAPNVTVAPYIKPAETKVIVRDRNARRQRVERGKDGNISRVVEEEDGQTWSKRIVRDKDGNISRVIEED